MRALGTRISPNSVTVTCDNPVTVMGVNKETFSNDAFIAFEERTLGKRRSFVKVCFCDRN